MPNTSAKRYTLTNGENTYSSPASVNEADARKLQSLIPQLAGELSRERPVIPFATNAAFSSRVGFFHQFKRNNNGTIVTYWFCATATTLYQLAGILGNFTWNPVSSVGTLGGFPVAVNINNTLHLSDGVKSWIFDGTNWVTDGLAIPLHAPVIQPGTPGSAVNITSI